MRLTYSARVDRQAVVLVVNNRVGDVDTSAGTDIKGVGVVATLGVTIRIVDDDAVEVQCLRAVDAEDLHGRVLDGKALNLGVDQLVGREELGLLLATVGSLGVPPASTISVEHGARGTLDGDISSRNRDQGTLPLLVAKSGSTLEDDLGEPFSGQSHLFFKTCVNI